MIPMDNSTDARLFIKVGADMRDVSERACLAIYSKPPEPTHPTWDEYSILGSGSREELVMMAVTHNRMLIHNGLFERVQQATRNLMDNGGGAIRSG